MPLICPFRVTIQSIHIGSKGNGAKKHADLRRASKEFIISELTAVGQNTSSDQTYGEAQQLRSRLQDPDDEHGKCFIGCEDAA